MRDHERAMLAYAHLADLSRQKLQPAGRVRFLILTAAAACRAGWPDVAERCRELVLEQNRRHLVGRYATLVDAMRSEDFQSLLRQLERLCPYERAEHLVRAAGREIDSGGEAGPQALAVLEDE